MLRADRMGKYELHPQRQNQNVVEGKGGLFPNEAAKIADIKQRGDPLLRQQRDAKSDGHAAFLPS